MTQPPPTPSPRPRAAQPRRVLALVAALASLASVLVVGGSPAGAAVVPGASVVGVVAHAAGDGYWVASTDGRVSALGAAPDLGDGPAGSVGMTATPSGNGYWLVTGSGLVAAFGDAPFLGDVRSIPLSRPIVGMATTPSGGGYWLVASDGGIFNFGDAAFFGSTGAMRLNQPIVGMSATGSGRGYWLVASDGGIFSFGDARFLGSTGGIVLNRPITGMSTTPSGRGYWLVASDGGIFSFGDATFHGSLGANGELAVGMATVPGGYWLVTADGRVVALSSTARYASQGSCPPWLFACAGPSGMSNSGASAISAEIVERHNAERVARGLAPLVWDPDLAALGVGWSTQMTTSGFFHRTLSQLFSDPVVGGRYDALGENLYRGGGSYATAGYAHDGWMDSAGHRANLLNGGYDAIGVGVFCDGSGQLWATVYFGRSRGNATPVASAAPPATPQVFSDGGGPRC
jgi:uncharacterized protein YkwD